MQQIQERPKISADNARQIALLRQRIRQRKDHALKRGQAYFNRQEA